MQKALFYVLESIGFKDIDIENFQANDSPIEPGEIVLGDMNDFEKTCYAFLSKKEAEHQELHKKMESLDEDSNEADDLAHEHGLLKDAADAIKNLMWLSIGKRFGNQKNSSGYGIRIGNKIVTRPQKEKGFLDDMPSGIMVISMMGI